MTDELKRDERLGAALRDLPVGEHGDEFWLGLDERLLDDRRARRAAQQAPTGPGDESAGSGAPEAVPPGTARLGMGRVGAGRGGGPGWSGGPRRPGQPGRPAQPGAGGRSRAYTQDPSSIVLELARHATDLTPHRRTPMFGRRRGRLGVALALFVTAVIVIVAVAFLFGRGSSPEEAAADEATATVADITEAMSSPTSLSGGLTVTEFTAQTGVPEPVGRTYTFVWRVDGSYRYTLADSTFDEGYDAALGSRRILQVAPGFGSVVHDDANVAPGPPDGASPGLPLADAMVTVLRAVVADPSGTTIADEERDDQDVLIVDTPIPKVTDPGPDRARLAVNPDTKLPVAVSFLTGDQPWEDIRVDNLAVDAPLGAENFVVPIPGGADVTTSDAGFRRVGSPAEATAAVGYAATVPAYIPAGFKLAEVAVAGQASSPGAVNPDGTQAPPQVAQNVIFLSYRRGFEQMTVTTRRGVEPISDRWTDPFGTVPGVEARGVELESGRFDGVTVDLVQAQPAWPHLWGHTDELVFTVGGALPSDELTRIAESLD